MTNKQVEQVVAGLRHEALGCLLFEKAMAKEVPDRAREACGLAKGLDHAADVIEQVAGLAKKKRRR